MKENILKIKSFAFALRIVKLYSYLKTDKTEYILSKQLMRSGTSIGALICESEHAESKKDFIHKLNIALKEANESEYWLQLLHQSNYLTDAEFNSIHYEIITLLKLLITSIKTTKNNL